MPLSVSRLVRVSINLSPLAAARRSFGILMVAGDSNVISGLERFRTYSTYEGVTADFGLNAPESKAAALYFGQTPKPSTIMIGRWLRTATSGQNIGGILSTAQQNVSNFNSISDGSFVVQIDGQVQVITSVDLTIINNMNDVADTITGYMTGATMTWSGTNFVLTSNSTGAGAKASGSIDFTGQPSYGSQATGTITLTGNPSNGDTVTIHSTTLTFVTGTPSGAQVKIGVTTADTSANLQAFLSTTVIGGFTDNTYETLSLVTTITSRIFSTAANAYTLAKSGANITVSGATLTGGVDPDTVTINGGGGVFTFVKTITTTDNQSLVGPTLADSIGNLVQALTNSVITAVNLATYVKVGNSVKVTYKTPGPSGNGFTLAESSANITVSGGTLTGGVLQSQVLYLSPQGSGTDLSVLLKLNSALSQGLSVGYDAETPAECAAVLANKSSAWFGLMFNASVQPTNDQDLDVSTFIEALDLKRVFGVSITDTDVLSDITTTDLASKMRDAGYLQSFCQYSSNPQAIASFFGRAFSVDFNANRSTITLMYKQEPGVTGEDLTETEALTLQAKRCNVFVTYDNNTVIIQYGVMSGPAYFDEIHGLDWLQNAIQTNCYNVLYTTTTKIPQTDAGVNQLVNAVSQACDQAVNNGLVAPGIWTGDIFGQLQPNQYLKNGYYIYAQPVALQSQSDREARKAPPIQVAVKLAGAIQEVDVIVDVNR